MKSSQTHIYLMGVPDQPLRKVGITSSLNLRLDQVREETGRKSMQIIDSFPAESRALEQKCAGPFPRKIELSSRRVAQDIEDLIKLLGSRVGYGGGYEGAGRMTEYFTWEVDDLFKTIKLDYLSGGYAKVLESAVELNELAEKIQAEELNKYGAQWVRMRHILRMVYIGSTAWAYGTQNLSVNEAIEDRAKYFFPKPTRKKAA